MSTPLKVSTNRHYFVQDPASPSKDYHSPSPVLKRHSVSRPLAESPFKKDDKCLGQPVEIIKGK